MRVKYLICDENRSAPNPSPDLNTENRLRGNVVTLNTHNSPWLMFVTKLLLCFNAIKIVAGLGTKLRNNHDISDFMFDEEQYLSTLYNIYAENALISSGTNKQLTCKAIL